jgi:hypothetical protein
MKFPKRKRNLFEWKSEWYHLEAVEQEEIKQHESE